MRLVLGDESIWTLHFHHHFLDDAENEHRYNVVTSARLHAGPCSHVGENDACTKASFTGLAKCSRSDAFNKAYGRKLALDRMFKTNEISYSLRSQIWLAYWAISPPQRAKLRMAVPHAA